MTEGIEYHEIGTIDVTFDDKTYHLGRPKFKQWKYFTRKLNDQRDEAIEAIQGIRRQLEDAEARFAGKEDTPEAKEEVRRLQDLFQAAQRDPFYQRTVGILAEMFDQVGEPLPADPDDWPAWLAADSALPGTILEWWKNHPKASGHSPAT